ncbi:hypothetical protein E2C01_071123 [Portunus trituberculatus]|uniref:Uncharacterized protein n=1 Tax=Portunus trituberculatus TaxID=210409 RepID=A0A5B7I4D3_PORTR|nr:hypothetical protein [Portunus trituberculatus]
MNRLTYKGYGMVKLGQIKSGKVVLPLSLKASAIRSVGDQAITLLSRSGVGNGPVVYDAFSTCVETGSGVLARLWH